LESRISLRYNPRVPIHLLSADIASQIAAGEVVERPASVVKELLENALDAGARSISISIEEAGRQAIEVSDDGAGIAESELTLAVARHATSKLSSAEELFKIATLGFRGEALASIGAVSRMTITAREGQASHGAEVVVEAGQVGKPTKVGSPNGTRVVVRDLFFNVPARLRFLKKDLTERRAVEALVSRYALAYASVRIRMTVDGAVVLQTAGDGDRRAVLANMYGLDLAKQMLEVEAADDGMEVRGFISPISITRSNRREITFFVNGRWVQDTALTAALTKAYHALLMVGRYPIAVVFLDLPRDTVDVNVHPAKSEVRFREPDRVFSFLQRAIRRGLLAYSPIPTLVPGTWVSEPNLDASEPLLQVQSRDGATGFSTSVADWARSADLWSAPGPSDTGRTQRIPILRLIGQIGATYLVAEGPDGLYLVDQHAAHERVLYEKLMAARASHQPLSQQLLTPAVVQVRPDQSDLLLSQAGHLENLGFEIHEFGANAFQVRSMPAFLARGEPAAALHAVIEDFEDDETPFGTEVEARLAARICKRLAVRGGQVLTTAEQQALLSDLEACASPRTCPHGRPTMIHLSVDMLEKQFGRRGPR